MNRATPRDLGGALRLGCWLGALLFALYLLSFSGRFHVMDELAVFTVGHNLAAYGQADINQLIWTNHWTPDPPGVWGNDGNLYTKKAPGISLLTALLLRLFAGWEGISRVHAGLLAGPLLVALTAGLLVVWLVQSGFSRRVGLLTAFLYGNCTFAWVFGRMLWDLPAVGLLGVGMLIALAEAERREEAGAGPVGWWLAAGGCAALALLFRYEALFLAGLAGLALLFPRPFVPGRVMRRLVPFLLPLLPVAAGLVIFNLARFGALSETGYSREIAFSPSWFSLFGLSFSPGQGIFTFSPLLLLTFAGIGNVRRRISRRLFRLVVAICLCAWLFYSSWFAWGGLWNWGTRFLLTVLPLLMLFVAGALDAWGERRWFRLLIGLLALCGLLFNGASMIVDFNEYFSRLTSNRDFVLQWRYFIPLGNWRVFLEGYPVDLAWAEAGPAGTIWHWRALWPVLAGGLLAGAGLAWATRSRSGGWRAWAICGAGLLLVALLAGQALENYSRLEQAQTAHQRDRELLALLGAQAAPGDRLLISGPPYGDFQELAVRLMAYQPQALPIFFWMEGSERGIGEAERTRLQGAVQAGVDAGGGRIWHLERLYSPADGLTPTVRRLEADYFLAAQAEIGQSGRLSCYIPGGALTTVPAAVGFESGLTLEAFAIPPGALTAGAYLPVRLTWRAEAAGESGPITGFVHLLAEAELSRRVAESDRFLYDSRQPGHSPLQSGESRGQGHLLSLHAELPAGKYVLVAGLYRSQDGVRLRRTDGSGDDFVYLTTFSVTAAPSGQ